MSQEDPFGGSWKLNPEKSHFDPNHRVSAGTMHWERTTDGYLMHAEGTHDGQVCRERPQTFILDAKDHALPGLPGFTAVAFRATTNEIRVEAKNAGQVVGKGSYVVSEDGTTLTATTVGRDAQQRTFQTVVVWDRQ